MAVAASEAEKICNQSDIILMEQTIDAISIEDAIKKCRSENERYILKLDCECGEWDILQNISTELAQKIVLVFGEWHSDDPQKIIHACKKSFPHLYTSTHTGWGCGNFWCVPNEERNRYFADSLSLNSLNIYATNKVNYLQEEISALKLKMEQKTIDDNADIASLLESLKRAIVNKARRKFGF